MEWISVKDRLPEEGRAILVYCPQYKNQYCAFLTDGTWMIFCDVSIICKEDVKYWMPLPEPPKGE